MYNPPEMGARGDREALAQERLNVLNVSIRMENLMPVLIRQLKMLLGVPAHVSLK